MLQFDLQFYEELTVAWVRTVKLISGAFFWPTGQLVFMKVKNYIRYSHANFQYEFYGSECTLEKLRREKSIQVYSNSISLLIVQVNSEQKKKHYPPGNHHASHF